MLWSRRVVKHPFKIWKHGKQTSVNYQILGQKSFDVKSVTLKAQDLHIKIFIGG